jgi:hypothetical protein
LRALLTLVCFLVFYQPIGKHLALLSDVVSRFKSFSEAPHLTKKCGTRRSDSPVAPERVSRAEAEKATVLVSAHEDAKGFVLKTALLEDGLAAGHQAWEVSERER